MPVAKELSRLNEFLANTLGSIEKAIVKSSITGTKDSNPKIPKHVQRWNEFKGDSANFEYPKIVIGNDVYPSVSWGI